MSFSNSSELTTGFPSLNSNCSSFFNCYSDSLCVSYYYYWGCSSYYYWGYYSSCSFFSSSTSVAIAFAFSLEGTKSATLNSAAIFIHSSCLGLLFRSSYKSASFKLKIFARRQAIARINCRCNSFLESKISSVGGRFGRDQNKLPSLVLVSKG